MLRSDIEEGGGSFEGFFLEFGEDCSVDEGGDAGELHRIKNI